MTILSVRHAWPEKAGFQINRPNGLDNYTFLHFFNSVKLLDNSKAVITKPHAFMIYAPGTPQWFCSGSTLLHDWMHLCASCQPELEHYDLPVNTVFYLHEHSFVTELFHQIENEFFSCKPCHEELIDCKVTELLVKLSRACHSDNEISCLDQDTNALFRAIRNDLLLNYQQKWTIPQLASKAGFSVSQFHLIYKQIFGSTPANDLILARIRSAQNYLSNSNANIRNIGELCGYEDESYFIRQFRNIVGVTPAEYRKSNKQ